ncbi:LOW QUALITY PROTEIN: uncharacterized protein Dyak_GE27552 [Drosophila yakuba]|uniref:Uncharacterized protein n=1 Tax=Drosophila yakuba TaxID=7245 RepID=A0A0R1EBW5_DROYA|nr:LOW QUALITY PROTEIN: uncharacterized protein Dyak_GE27552 [Drosophila yakuba]
MVPPRFVFGGTSSWIRHWVTGSAHRSICSVATMTSAAAGKWPLQARHMLLLRPATSAPRKRGATPFQPSTTGTTTAARRRRVNNVWAAPESRQRFFLHRSAENKQRIMWQASLNCFSWTLQEFGVVGKN